MSSAKRAHSRWSVLKKTLIGITAVTLGLYVVIATVQKAQESYRIAQEADALRAEIARLKEENLMLQSELNYHLSDEYIERAAREQLNLVKPGDVLLLVLSPTPTPVPVPAPRGRS